MATSLVTEQDIRIFLQDFTELNPLLDGVRFSPEMIERAMIYVADYFNMANPPLIEAVTVENFPYRYLLLIGVAGHLLRGTAVNEASNNLTYAADGIQVDDKDKAQIFTSLGNNFWGEFKDLVKETKIAINIHGAYGRKLSEYSYRARV